MNWKVCVWATCEMTHVIFLSFKFLTEVKLVGLQLHQPLPQLVGLLPEHRSDGEEAIFKAWSLRSCSQRPESQDVLQLVLIQVIDIQSFPSLSQDLLLLLPLSQLLGSSPALTLWENKQTRADKAQMHVVICVTLTLKSHDVRLMAACEAKSCIHTSVSSYVIVILKVGTFCAAPYCWVMLERTFFFLASSSSFLRCSSCSLRSFSSCRVHGQVTQRRHSHLCSAETWTLWRCESSPRVWPASPSLSPLGLFAAPLSRRDVSPGDRTIVVKFVNVLMT